MKRLVIFSLASLIFFLGLHVINQLQKQRNEEMMMSIILNCETSGDELYSNLKAKACPDNLANCKLDDKVEAGIEAQTKEFVNTCVDSY